MVTFKLHSYPSVITESPTDLLPTTNLAFNEVSNLASFDNFIKQP